jgi:hypothetical protein
MYIENPNAVDPSKAEASHGALSAEQLTKALYASGNRQIELKNVIGLGGALVGAAQELGMAIDASWTLKDLGAAFARRLTSARAQGGADLDIIERCFGKLATVLQEHLEPPKLAHAERNIDDAFFCKNFRTHVAAFVPWLSTPALKAMQSFAEMVEPGLKFRQIRANLGEYLLAADQFRPADLKELEAARLIKERRWISPFGREFVGLTGTGAHLLAMVVQDPNLPRQSTKVASPIEALFAAHSRIGFYDSQESSRSIWLKLAASGVAGEETSTCVTKRARELEKRAVTVEEVSLAIVHSATAHFDGVLHYLAYKRRFEMQRSFDESLEDLVSIDCLETLSSQGLTSVIAQQWEELGADRLSKEAQRWWTTHKKAFGSEHKGSLCALLLAIESANGDLMEYYTAAEYASTNDVGALLHYMELRRFRAADRAQAICER